jgi:ribose 5-phosphate isomerase RpiB
MKAAVINEVSARDKNPFIVKALEKRGIEVCNLGMKEGDYPGEGLTYIHTGLMAGLVINLCGADIVVGGCGTGEGFMISAMQYPGVFCGLIESPLDAFLFGQINGGNCISLALNKGYGWAGDINLEYIFEKLFSDGYGQGYPEARRASQRESRERLRTISALVHRPMTEILEGLDTNILSAIFNHRPFADFVKNGCPQSQLRDMILQKFIGR